MPIDTVAAGFETFRTKVIPDHAPKIQTEECRRAFYAGAYFMLMNSFIAIGDETMDDEQGIVELERLRDEIETYVASLQPGYTLPDEKRDPEQWPCSFGHHEHATRAEAVACARARLDKEPAAPAIKPSLIVAPDISYTTDDPDHIKPKLQALGRVIGEQLPAGYGFMLMIFNFGAGGNLFYISNTDRADMITAIREFLRKQIS